MTETIIPVTTHSAELLPCRVCRFRPADEGCSDQMCSACFKDRVPLLCYWCRSRDQVPGHVYCRECITEYEARDTAAQCAPKAKKRAAAAAETVTKGQVFLACCLMIAVVIGLAVGLSKFGPEHSREIARAEAAMDAAGIVQVAGPRGNLP